MALDFENSVLIQLGDTEILRTPFQIGVSDATYLRGFKYSVLSLGKKRSQLPVLCIPSDLGNAMEFERLAHQILAQDTGPVSIYALSLRGRGHSDRSTLESYSPVIAAEDIIAVCDALGLHSIACLANAGGAIAAFLTAPKRPTLIQRLILNDAAPEKDGVGIARLRTLSKNHPTAASPEEAVERERAMLGSMFPAFGDPDWRERVDTIWLESHDGTASYDPVLNDYFNQLDYEERQPTLWPEFNLFAKRPVLLFRGEHSLLITDELVDRMRNVVPDLVDRIVPGQGHFPLLTKDDLALEINGFLKS